MPLTLFAISMAVKFVADASKSNCHTAKASVVEVGMLVVAAAREVLPLLAVEIPDAMNAARLITSHETAPSETAVLAAGDVDHRDHEAHLASETVAADLDRLLVHDLDAHDHPFELPLQLLQQLVAVAADHAAHVATTEKMTVAEMELMRSLVSDHLVETKLCGV